MTSKRFKKLLMGAGWSRNAAEYSTYLVRTTYTNISYQAVWENYQTLTQRKSTEEKPNGRH